MEEEDTPAPSKGYDLSFLDKLDDPNFDPFKTKSSVTNDIQATNRSCSPPFNSNIKNDETSKTDFQKSKSHRSDKIKSTNEVIHDPNGINDDTFQPDDPIQEISNSNEMVKSQEKSPIKSKPRPLRSETFKIKENKNYDKTSEPTITNTKKLFIIIKMSCVQSKIRLVLCSMVDKSGNIIL